MGVRYLNYLKSLKKCPFCGVNSSKIISSNDHAFLIVSKAPYHDDHLLVVPKRHNSSFLRLKDSELSSINELLGVGIKLLGLKGHKSSSVLLRNRKASGKSVDHLHYHIIPDVKIVTLHKDLDSREIISNSLELSKVRSFRKLL